MRKHAIQNVVVGAALAAIIVMAPACATFHCDPSWDSATCSVNTAIAVGGQVDLAAQALLVLPFLPPAVTAAIQAYHSAYPLAVAAAQTALDIYESSHSGDYLTALGILTQLYTNISNLLAAAGHPGVLATAQTQVKTIGVSQVLTTLRAGTLKGVLR